MKQLVETLVRYLVDQPDAVTVTVKESPRSVTFEVRVAAGEMGKVIGRHGRVARAIRSVVKAAAVRDGRRVNVEFVE